jgi:hypothetical protein
MKSTVDIHSQYNKFIQRKDKVEGSLHPIASARLGTAFSFSSGLESAACELRFSTGYSSSSICISMTAALNLRDQLNAALRKNGVIVS